MTTNTYEFTAYAIEDLFGPSVTSPSAWQTFTMPPSATVSVSVTDDDTFLSADYAANENADDQSYQTASITDVAGNPVGNAGQIYAESYYYVIDQLGNFYMMIELEQENGSSYYTFYNANGYSVPPAGAKLTILSQYDVTQNIFDYANLHGGDTPASISGTFFLDRDHNNVDDAGDDDIAGATVELYAWNGTSSYFAGTTTTDQNGDYSFGNLQEGWYYVRFVHPDTGVEFVSKDAGLNDAIGSDVNDGGYSDWVWVAEGEAKTDVDAGIRDDAIQIDAVDDLITVFESETSGDLETLDDGAGSVLGNDTADGQPFVGSVVEVNGVTGNVGEFIDLAAGGRVKINADGTVDFDADGDFDSLNAGDSDIVTVNYTIATRGEAAKTNLLFVIDTSGSTLGQNGLAEGAFDGVGAGDVNGDGFSDTVLDAQLLAVRSAIEDLLASGIDPATVTVGLVTFDNAGAIRGTFALNDPALINAITAIQGNPNGFTNYDDGLNRAIEWFNGRPADGAENKVVFLSDGVPRDPDGVSIQDISVYGPEVAVLTDVSGINADIEAIAVGNQAELANLNDLDNTGGALRVTDATTLTTAVSDAAAVTVTDTATVTIKVLGEDDPLPTIDALDDHITVFESETEGDIEEIDGNPNAIDSVLDNDTDNGLPFTGDVVQVNGQTGNVGQFIQITDAAGNSAGRVKINADGTVDFDADGDGDGVSDFEALNEGESDAVEVNYTIAREIKSDILIEDVWFAAQVAPDPDPDPNPDPDPHADCPPVEGAVLNVGFDRAEGRLQVSIDFPAANLPDGRKVIATDTTELRDVLESLGASSVISDDDTGSLIYLDVDAIFPHLIEASDAEIEALIDQIYSATPVIEFTYETQSGSTQKGVYKFPVDTPPVNIFSPIAFDLNGDGRIGVTGVSTARERVTDEVNATVDFDIDADGDLDRIEWLSGDGDALLIDNRDGLAAVNTDGSRLFGDQGGLFANGFAKLALLDADGDTVISGDELDGLELWVDDGDAVVEAGELRQLAEFGITSIATTFENVLNDRGETLMQSSAHVTEAIIEDSATVTITVLGEDAPANLSTLSGTVETAAAQSITFIIDHSLDTLRGAPTDGGVFSDLNNDGSIAVFDVFLQQIVDLALTLEDSRQINILLTGRDEDVAGGTPDGVVGEVALTAADIKLANAGGLDALRSLLSPLAGISGSETELDLALALNKARDVITDGGNRPDGNFTDDIVVLTSTDGFGTFSDVNQDRNGDGTNDFFDSTTLPPFFVGGFVSDESVPGVVDVEESDEIEALAALGVDIDVLYIDPNATLDTGILDAVNSVGDAQLITGGTPFGLENLISAPEVLGQVVGVEVDGVFTPLNDDITVDGFEFVLTDLVEDPTAGTFVDIDTDGDLTTVEQRIDVTAQLTPGDTPDSFVFTIDLNDFV